MINNLEKEAEEIQKLIMGKTVSKVHRPSKNDICIEFSDKSRIFVTAEKSEKLYISVT